MSSFKQCGICKEHKELIEFPKNKAFKDGLSNRCRPCNKQHCREYQLRNIEKIKIKKREYAKANYKSRKNRDLFNMYGITLHQYDQMLFSQKGRCKICDVHHTECRKSLHVDHCHKTGKVRGLLCDTCNRALGLFKDSSHILETASKYLKDAMVEGLKSEADKDHDIQLASIKAKSDEKKAASKKKPE